jgi:hypothetical protein
MKTSNQETMIMTPRTSTQIRKGIRTMNSTLKAFALIAAALCLLTPFRAAASRITNPGFEDGLTGWNDTSYDGTVVGGWGAYANSAPVSFPALGENVALSNVGSTQSTYVLWQSLGRDYVAGHEYSLSADFQRASFHPYTTIAGVELRYGLNWVDGTVVASQQSDPLGISATALGLTTSFTASGAEVGQNIIVGITLNNPSATPDVYSQTAADNVIFIPEPASALILALMGVFALGRRRRR